MSAEQELKAFSYIVSHDLAASFRQVAGFSRLLLGELGEGVTDRQQAHADHIRSATDRCQLMMDQLLVFSGVQQKTLAPVRQDATAAVRLAMLQLGVGEASGVAVAIEPLGEVWADAGLFALAVHGLLDNAIKFRRPDSLARVTVQPAHDEAFWRMRITDNGRGVDPAHRDRAFGMFRRLNGEEGPPGVGAGLAICRRIARRHGGEAKFLDCVDGACVELALPREATAQ